MPSPRTASLRRALASSLVVFLGAMIARCAAPASVSAAAATSRPSELEARAAHLDRVQRAEFCASCHPEATAEHRMNTHGRAFEDGEVRLATARFSIAGCIDCHTPRPIFETGMGKNPIKRLHHLEEGNDCLSCHAKAGYDFSRFAGGAECKAAFDPRAGSVEACASCHRNHGTPYQWENAKYGKLSGNVCIDCHMPEVVRPVAVGLAPRKTRRHTFFASRSASQLAQAYEYDARLEGNEIVVSVRNAGAGHNFPTELKQRSVESLVVIRDGAGREVARSRQVHRDPYKRPYGLTLPVNTQIPSGESREHRVPIPIETGTVECTLFYKLYYPIEDEHPDLSRTLESRSFAFGPIVPSKKPITTPPEIHATLPEALPVEVASPGNLADFARPKIERVPVEVPDGSKDGDVEKLVALFQFPVPEANQKAGDALVKLGERAVPALVEALASWDAKTWMQAQQALVRIGKPAAAPLVRALSHPELYVRCHAREILPRMERGALPGAELEAAATRGLQSPSPLDRASTADLVGKLGFQPFAPALRALLEDLDFDVCAAAARALAALGDRSAAPEIRRALARNAAVAETARDLAWSLAALGENDGAEALLGMLDYPDDLVRESCFEAWLDVTGVSLGYAATLPREDRLAALASLRAWWATKGAAPVLRRPRSREAPAALRAEIAQLVRNAGGNDVATPNAEATERAIARLVEIGRAATPQIVEGLKWPAGFLDKRVALLRVLAANPDPDALPALLEATRDPALTTTLWAVQALESLRATEAIPHLAAAQSRFDAAAAAGRLPANLGHPEDARVLFGRARMKAGDPEGLRLLERLLFSQEETARNGAESALSTALADPQLSSQSWLGDARRALESLPERRRAWIEGLRAVWRRNAEAASAAREGAQTREQILAALVAYDFAEESATRYASLDGRAFVVDFQQTIAGADDLSARLFDDTDFLRALPARDLLSIVERRGASQSASGVDVRFEGNTLSMEAPEDGGGVVDFGLGGAGGRATAMEWWRDYELHFDLTVERKGVWILDRYDPIWAIYQRTAITTEAPEVSGVLHAPVEEGKTYSIRHSVVGSDVVHAQSVRAAGDAAPKPEEYRASMPLKVRKGGFVLQVPPGGKVVIRDLRLKLIRADAAESANAAIATPGR